MTRQTLSTRLTCSPRVGRRLALALSLGAVLGWTPPPVARAAAILYVASTGTAYFDCLSPAQPCPTINAALSHASDGDTIRIVGGTYTSTTAEVVNLTKAVTLSGGWDPTFSVQDRDTILDGEGVRRVVSIWVVSVTLDHLTLTRGAGSEGAGIYIPFGSVRIVDSVVRDNVAAGTGGGLCTGGYNALIEVERSAFVHNTAQWSGAIGACNATDFPGRLVAINSTFSDNAAQSVGGVSMDGWYGDGTIELYSTSVVSNTATVSGGGIGTAQAVTLTNSLIAENLAGGTLSDCVGGVVSLGYNLFSSTAGCGVALTTGDQVVLHPDVLPLSLPSGVHPLSASSPAVDGGDPSGCRAPGGQALTVDQRGQPRVAAPTAGGSARCDIGAYEVQPITLSGVTLAIDAPRVAGQPGSAMARVTPSDVTGPMTYTWQVGTGAPVIQVAGTESHWTFFWPETGPQAVSVSVSDGQGSPVTAHEDVVVQARAMLAAAPGVLRASAHLPGVLAVSGPVQNPTTVTYSLDNGLTWTSLPLPAGARVDDLALIQRYETNPPVRVLTTDGAQGVFARTGNYGAGWATATVPLLSGCVQPYDLFVAASSLAHQDVYAAAACLVRVECPAGGVCVAHLRRQLYESTDAGVSWAALGDPVEAQEPQSAHWGAEQLHLAPSASTLYWAPNGTWRRRDSLGTWSDVPGAAFTGTEDSELQIDAAHDTWLYRLDGATLRATTDVGATWTSTTLPACPAPDDRELVADATHASGLYFRCANRVWSSVNGGQAWTLRATLTASETGQVFGLGHRLVSDPLVAGRLWWLGDQHVWALVDGEPAVRAVADVAATPHRVLLPTLLTTARP